MTAIYHLDLRFDWMPDGMQLTTELDVENDSDAIEIASRLRQEVPGARVLLSRSSVVTEYLD